MTVTRHTYAPLFDDTEFTRRIVHDQQFVDLSERYDPREEPYELQEGMQLTFVEKALVITAWSAGLFMAAYAWIL